MFCFIVLIISGLISSAKNLSDMPKFSFPNFAHISSAKDAVDSTEHSESCTSMCRELWKCPLTVGRENPCIYSWEHRAMELIQEWVRDRDF